MQDKLFAASIDKNIHQIDLHQTRSVDQAIEYLEQELYKLIGAQDYCRVVYGIGGGILRKKILNYLKQVTYIQDFREDPEHPGSCIVIM